MKKLIKRLILLILISMGTFPLVADGAGAAKGKADETVMHLHHMHTLMNHGLVMTLQGSNLSIFAGMRDGAALAGIAAPHGREMMAEGKKTLKDVLSGSEMKAAHERGRWDDPLMGYTHELGAELLAVVDDLDKIDLHQEGAAARQIVLNHALEMAAQGANLVMLGKMKMAGPVDQRTLRHGRKMLADARKLWEKVVASEGMPQQGAHPFVKHGAKVLSLLEKMSALQY